MARFRDLHAGPTPLLLPNAWDAGSARLLAGLGFQAVATTSSGFARTLGRLDGSVSRAEALTHARAIVDAVDVPVSADLEDGFAGDPSGVADTVRDAVACGLAGCSIEDFTRDRDDPIYAFGAATERVAAAVEAARSGGRDFVLTARAENHLHGRDDLDETIRRLQAYAAAGADVLYAPGLRALDDIRTVVDAVDRPVNVLTFPGAPPVDELGSVGVARVSVGGAFQLVALGAVVEAASELREQGTYGFLTAAGVGRAAADPQYDPPGRA